MGYKIILLALATLLICDYVSAGWGVCPPKNKVYNNQPVCHTDADCQKYGKICCPNQYNTKSCTNRAPWLSHNGKDKYSGSGSWFGNCGGVKCMPWEVCKPDRYSKKHTCQKR